MTLGSASGTEVDRRSPFAPQVYRTLRRAIISLELLPGAGLSEQEVARRLRISRTPVREAFIRLAEEGLVNVFPQQGTVVAPIDLGSVLEGQFVREALEVAAARQAAQEADPGLRISLSEYLTEQRRACESGELNRFHELDEAFHGAIFLKTRHPTAWRVTLAARGHLDRVRHLGLPDPLWLQLALKQHEQIVGAVIDGEADRVEHAVREHARAILAIVPDLSRRYPQYFVARNGGAVAAPEATETVSVVGLATKD